MTRRPASGSRRAVGAHLHQPSHSMQGSGDWPSANGKKGSPYQGRSPQSASHCGCRSERSKAYRRSLRMGNGRRIRHRSSRPCRRRHCYRSSTSPSRSPRSCAGTLCRPRRHLELQNRSWSCSGLTTRRASRCTAGHRVFRLRDSLPARARRRMQRCRRRIRLERELTCSPVRGHGEHSISRRRSNRGQPRPAPRPALNASAERTLSGDPPFRAGTSQRRAF